MKWSTPKQYGHCSVTVTGTPDLQLMNFWSIIWLDLGKGSTRSCEGNFVNLVEITFIIFKKIIIICTRHQDRNSSLLDESPFYIHHHLDLLLMLSFSLFIFHHLTSSFAGVVTTMATRGLCRTFSIWSSEDSLIIQLSWYMQNIPDLYFWVF